jgi:hypothetical protein
MCNKEKENKNGITVKILDSTGFSRVNASNINFLRQEKDRNKIRSGERTFLGSVRCSIIINI